MTNFAQNFRGCDFSKRARAKAVTTATKETETLFLTDYAIPRKNFFRIFSQKRSLFAILGSEDFRKVDRENLKIARSNFELSSQNL